VTADLVYVLQSVPLFHVIGSHSLMQLITFAGGKVSSPVLYTLPILRLSRCHANPEPLSFLQINLAF
jgi:hypothetical protein